MPGSPVWEEPKKITRIEREQELKQKFFDAGWNACIVALRKLAEDGKLPSVEEVLKDPQMKLPAPPYGSVVVER